MKWHIALLLAAAAVAIVVVDAQKADDEPLVFLVRVPLDELEDDSTLESAYYHPRDIFQKRAIPFNGGMYGKRSTMPFSGGMYGKRSGGGHIYAERRAAIPFSGGMYGKRSLSQATQAYANNENQIKRGAMPFSGGMYGR